MLSQRLVSSVLCFALLQSAKADDGFDPEEAKKFASLASLTYCEDTSQVAAWTCQACTDSQTPVQPGSVRIVDAGSGNATRIVVAKLKDQNGCLMSFRGSKNVINWVRDFQTWDVRPTAFADCDGCQVHAGFYEIWKNVQDQVVQSVRDVGCSQEAGADNLLYITGHSLGAALTHLAMFALDSAGFRIAKSYSFEAPRVGNEAFSKAFSNQFVSKMPLYRITHAQDPVVHVPPEALGFTHVEREVWYDTTGGYKVATQIEDPACADQYWNVPDMVAFHAGDHCGTTPGTLLPNNDFCNPVGCAGSSNMVVI
jgi:hypothetical protein